MSNSPAEDLGTYAATQGHGTAGTDIFFNSRSDTPGFPDNVIVFSDTGGFPPDMAMGGTSTNPVFENPTIQVLVQNNNLETAFTKCYNIFSLLCGLKDQTIDSTVYLLVTPMSNPFVLGRDENDRHRIICNFVVNRRPPA